MSLIAVAKDNGKDLARERIRRGYSVRKLAELAELSPAAISKIESGSTVSTRPLSAQKICNGLGIDLEDMFELKQKV